MSVSLSEMFRSGALRLLREEGDLVGDGKLEGEYMLRVRNGRLPVWNTEECDGSICPLVLYNLLKSESLCLISEPVEDQNHETSTLLLVLYLYISKFTPIPDLTVLFFQQFDNFIRLKKKR